MKVLVIGSAEMVDRKFSEKLAQTGILAGKKVTRLTMADVIAPLPLASSRFEIDLAVCDLSAPQAAENLIANRPDIVFHLAAIVSGEAEADFEKGYRINLSGTHYLFE